MDIEVFKSVKPDFYSQYETARIIISSTGSATAVMGEVTIKDSGEPLKNVTVTFTPVSNGMMKAAATTDNTELVKKTAEKGKFRIASLPEGTYTVTLHKNGYKDQTVTTNVTHGETTELIVELEKV